ncbi:MAG: HAMP domain-containing protein [Neisseriaceae bacterium]|nr:HAMP domain-containing protein [Neisseriaceae bacterium]
MGRFLVVVSVLTVIVLYLLSVSTYAATLSAQFRTVFALSSVVCLVLLFSLVRQLWKLQKDAKAQVLGSKLTQRLVRMFVSVVFVPSLAIFLVSSYFIKTTIDSWFNDEVSLALNRGVELSKNLLQEFQQDMQKEVQQWRQALPDDNSFQAALNNHPNANQFYHIIVFPQNNATPVAYGGASAVINHLPDISEFPTQIEMVSDTVALNNTLFVQVWLPEKEYWFLFRQPVPTEIANNIVYIENARSQYAQSSYNKNALQAFFLMTLVMATLLAMVLALLVAIYFARKFIAPLASLAQATNAVAQGDFTRRAPVYRQDELGIFSARFNRMVQQLQNAQITTEQMHIQQEQARRHLELVLSTLSSGVMTLDEAGSLKTFNDGARRILDFPLHELVGVSPEEWHNSEIADFIRQLTKNLQQENAVEIEYQTPDKTRILMGRAALLPNKQDILLVFDDVTDLASAQKEAAWGEVARRLAHEIKNPLTPIRLSAERLAMKLTDKLGETDAAMLNRSTDTIINQVDALQELVEGFRNYARSGSLKLIPTDFNQIVAEILVLYEYSAEYHFTVNRCEEPLMILADHTAIRQVLHNLFKNAAEAAADDETPQVWVSSATDGKNAVLVVKNNGKTFQSNMLHQIFEPYITDKPTGTGLGLAVVKKIIDEHHGTVSAGNEDDRATVKVTLPLFNGETR